MKILNLIKDFSIFSFLIVLSFQASFGYGYDQETITNDRGIYAVSNDWGFTPIRIDNKFDQVKRLAELYGALNIEKEKAFDWMKKSKAELRKEIALREAQINAKFVRKAR